MKPIFKVKTVFHEAFLPKLVELHISSRDDTEDEMPPHIDKKLGNPNVFQLIEPILKSCRSSLKKLRIEGDDEEFLEDQEIKGESISFPELETLEVNRGSKRLISLLSSFRTFASSKT